MTSSVEKITIVVADDHPLFRNGVCQALATDESLNIVGEAGNGEEALEIILARKPNIAILDISMPLMTGLQVAKELKNRNEEIEIVLLTMYDDEEILNEAMDLDVKAFILKDSAALDIVKAVHAAYYGRNYISTSLTSKLFVKRKKQDEILSGLKLLSAKEKKVLRLIAESKSTKEIANELFLSPKTVENYRYRISEKLNISGSYSLLKFALEHKETL